MLQGATSEMKSFLLELRKFVPVAIVGGSDLEKQKEQFGAECKANLIPSSHHI